MRKTFSLSVATVLATMLIAQEPAQAKFKVFEYLENWAVKRGLKKPRINKEETYPLDRKENILASPRPLQNESTYDPLDKLIAELAPSNASRNNMSRASLGLSYYIDQLTSNDVGARKKPPVPPRPPRNIPVNHDETTAQLDTRSTPRLPLQQESENQVQQYPYSTQRRNEEFLKFREKHPNLSQSAVTKMVHAFGATLYDTITAHMLRLDQVAEAQNLKLTSNPPSNNRVKAQIAATKLQTELKDQRDPAYSTYRGLAYNVKQRLFNGGTTKFNLSDVSRAENRFAMMFGTANLD